MAQSRPLVSGQGDREGHDRLGSMISQDYPASPLWEAYLFVTPPSILSRNYFLEDYLSITTSQNVISCHGRSRFQIRPRSVNAPCSCRYGEPCHCDSSGCHGNEQRPSPAQLLTNEQPLSGYVARLWESEDLRLIQPLVTRNFIRVLQRTPGGSTNTHQGLYLGKLHNVYSGCCLITIIRYRLPHQYSANTVIQTFICNTYMYLNTSG